MNSSRPSSPLLTPFLIVAVLAAAPFLWAAKGQAIQRQFMAVLQPTTASAQPVNGAPPKAKPAASNGTNAKPAGTGPAPTTKTAEPIKGAPVAPKYEVSPTVAVQDPNITPYPRSSLHNFSDVLDAPAGKRGFIESKNGHFYYQDGTRARFWGINVANTSLQESEADISAMIQNFRMAGFNLVRLHHFDERGGIIDLDAPNSRQLLPERIKKLDYWIYKAKQAGIYVYLDLLDYRRFKEGDGVVNAEKIGRAARPYAVFDPKLIELQKEYARKLMRDHVNQYTGLAYADDPAVVMLEIYDESGLFMKRGVWREMPEPYATNFQKLWNDWLRKRYKTTDALLRAWADAGGTSALTPGESLERGNVEVPAMTWTPKQIPESQRVYSMLARRNDGALFAYFLHKKYFEEMREYLRSIGVRIPVSVTGRFDDIADLKSISDELDFIGMNFYYDHPYWGTGAKAWTPPSYFHNKNPLSDVADTSMAAQISLARIKGKPMVVREWNYCWPNRNRAAGILEAAAYAALHDIDAMILFVYETRPTARVSYFNVRSDPSRWGLVGIGASIFLKNLIAPSRHRVIVPYNAVDTFTYTRYHQPFYALGWATRVENDFYDTVYRADNPKTDLLLMPGRSGYGRFEGAPSILQTSSLARDLAGRPGITPEYLEEYGLKSQRGGTFALSYNGVLQPTGTNLKRTLTFGLPLKPILQTGSQAIGFNHQNGIANGFVDKANQRLVFASLDPQDVLSASLDAMKIFYGVQNSHESNEQNVFSTDTGEMRRDSASGRFIISASKVQALAGNLTGVGRVLAPGLRARNVKNGTLVALALDGKPLVGSRHFMVKMVTDARNADESGGRDPRFLKNPAGQWIMNTLGQGPVLTDGKSSAAPIQIAIENRPLVDVYLSGGGFELYVDGNNWQFYADTPGTKFVLHRRPASGAELQQVMPDGTVLPLRATVQQNQVVALFPRDAAYVRLTGTS